MKDENRFSDEELTAYLDDELDYARTDEITKALSSDPRIRQRIEELSVNKQDITDAFDVLLQKAPTANVSSVNDSKFPVSLTASVACLLVSFVLGWGIANQLPDPAKDWRDYVAAYQALYINNTLSHIQVSEQVQRDELARVSKVLGKSVALEKLNQYSQLEYKRAQILGFQGQPLLQLTFLTAVGDPVALCIIRSADKKIDSIQMEDMENMSAASWDKAGYAYLLIGGKDKILIEDMAKKFSDIL